MALVSRSGLLIREWHGSGPWAALTRKSRHRYRPTVQAFSRRSATLSALAPTHDTASELTPRSTVAGTGLMFSRPMSRLLATLRRRRMPRLPGLNDRHPGQTVFVVGAGPQLSSLSESQVRALESRIVIAVNKVFYRLRPSYFLSAYVGELMLAVRRIPDAMLLHMRPVAAPPLIPGIHAIRRRVFQADVGLPRYVDDVAPTLDTKMNVALGATHLAYVMGASRVVFVGVEQRNRLHFWHDDENLRIRIRADLIARGDPDVLRVDHPYAGLAHDLAALDRSRDECLGPFYETDHAPTFAAYFDILRRARVDVVATTAESVVADAGARVESLDSLLATDREAAA